MRKWICWWTYYPHEPVGIVAETAGKARYKCWLKARKAFREAKFVDIRVILDRTPESKEPRDE
jgi:hypothetical protein